jgi:hypothetical protein
VTRLYTKYPHLAFQLASHIYVFANQAAAS